MKLKNIIILGVVFLGLLLSSAFAYFTFHKEINSAKKLPVMGLVNDFELTSADGKAFGKDDLNGHVWVADFFFTTCSDICPTMTKAMKAFSEKGAFRLGTRIVSITVNPEVDDAARLKKYAQTMSATAPAWYFLTGERAAIEGIALDSFKLGVKGEPAFHSASFALVDRNGYIRGYYNGLENDEIIRLNKDALTLLRER